MEDLVEGFLVLRQHAALRYLLLAQVITNFGNGLAPVAVVFYVMDRNLGPEILGIAGGIYGCCLAVMLLIGGHIGDSYDRLTVASRLSLVRGITQGGIALYLLCVADGTFGLYLGNGILGAAAGLSIPSSQGAMREVLPREQIHIGVKLRSILQEGSRVAGTGLAGPLCILVGAPAVLFVDALTFLIACVGFWLASQRRVDTVQRREGATIRLSDGFHEIRKTTWLMVLMIQSVITQLCFSGIESGLLPVWVGSRYGVEVWSVTSALMMAGSIVAGVALLRFDTRPSPASACLWLGLGCASALLFVPPLPVWVIWACALSQGVLVQIYNIQWDILVMARIPSDRLSGVIGSYQSVNFMGRPAGLFAFSVAIGSVGQARWLVIASLVSALVPLCAALYLWGKSQVAKR
ncbi:MFS transporter [Austwickia sp. TVS 96-490-7B]|uniref:MFS transporter n=1 Tax=Austwickia sp. TVS 96-490-7B TaxID=2830843 RepID=UPI001C575D65|nr:MFS transporter [Austwickia sp. TVS 96-490-7B]